MWVKVIFFSFLSLHAFDRSDRHITSVSESSSVSSLASEDDSQDAFSADSRVSSPTASVYHRLSQEQMCMYEYNQICNQVCRLLDRAAVLWNMRAKNTQITYYDQSTQRLMTSAFMLRSLNTHLEQHIETLKESLRLKEQIIAVFDKEKLLLQRGKQMFADQNAVLEATLKELMIKNEMLREMNSYLRKKIQQQRASQRSQVDYQSMRLSTIHV